MDQNEQYLPEDNTVVLSDPEGNEMSFEFLDLIEMDGTEYIVLLPLDDEDADAVVILRVESDPDNEDEDQYLPVEDPDTLQKVFELFKERFEEEFDIEEDEEG